MFIQSCILLLACSVPSGTGNVYGSLPNGVDAQPADIRLAAKQYESRWRSESVQEAAKGWLALADQIDSTWAVFQTVRSGNRDTWSSPALSALPGPTVWPEIEGQLRSRLHQSKWAPRDLVLLAMFETLMGERDMAWMQLSMFKDMSKQRIPLVCSLFCDLAEISGRNSRVESAYRFQAVNYHASSNRDSFEGVFVVPDLVALLGKERARSVLQDILRNFNGEIRLETRGAFARFARETALGMADRLKHAQWQLADDFDGGALFEAMDKRFPHPLPGSDPSCEFYSSAAWMRVMSLLTNDRSLEARALSESLVRANLPFGYLSAEEELYLRRLGKVETYLTFLQELATEHPDTQIVDWYFDAFDRFGQWDRATRYFDALVVQKGKQKRDHFYRKVFKLVDLDQPEEAAKMLGDYLQWFKKVDIKTIGNPAEVYIDFPAEKLYQIARYLHRSDYIDLAFLCGEKIANTRNDKALGFWFLPAMTEARGISTTMDLLVKSQKAIKQDYSRSNFYPQGIPELSNLLIAYSKVEKFPELLQVLTTSRNLGATDVAFLDQSYGTPAETSNVLLVAKALAQVGRTNDAAHGLKFILQRDESSDPAYELLLKLDPKGSGGLFDWIHRSLPSEPRPLVWKSEWLRRQGRLSEANLTIQQAIALDPQDTQAKESNTRFQSWEVLSRIENDMGNKKLSEYHRKRFVNLRKLFPEYAKRNQTIEFGLKQKYKELLADNPYDIITRFDMAASFVKEGKIDQAHAQVLEACQDLPSKIGPSSNIDFMTENLTFVEICVNSLTKQLELNPKSSVLHAAIGKMYATLGRGEEAKQSYLRAVSLDPDCYLAWKGLSTLKRETYIDVRLADKVYQNLIRLEPFDQIDAQSFVSDFKALWNIADKKLRTALSISEPIFALPASKKALGHVADSKEDSLRDSLWPPTAGDILQQDRTVMDFLRLMLTLPNVSAVKGQ